MTSTGVPDHQAFIDSACIFAEIEYDFRYGRPQRAREAARAWVGLIKLNVMGGIKWISPQTMARIGCPTVAVLPAAHKLSVEELGFTVEWLEAGDDFYLIDEHKCVVTKMLGDVTFRADEEERGCSITSLCEPQVLVRWHQLGTIFPDPRYTPPATFALIQPHGIEQEATPLSTVLFAAFPTESEARVWTNRRVDELCGRHPWFNRELDELPPVGVFLSDGKQPSQRGLFRLLVAVWTHRVQSNSSEQNENSTGNPDNCDGFWRIWLSFNSEPNHKGHECKADAPKE